MSYFGSMVALITPMHEDSSIDYTALKTLAAWHIECGTQGIMVAGSTGEAATLNPNERIHLIQTLASVIKGKIPLIAGCGTPSTQETITLTQAAKKVGANVALIVTPYYNKPTQEGLYLHYKTIAKACDIPIILYNVPSRTQVDLLPETVARLSKIKSIVGIKEAVGQLKRAREIRQLCGTDFLIYSGNDQTALDWMLNHCADGVISVTANVAPFLMQKMCEAALSGMKDKAIQCNDRLAPLHQDLFVETNPIPTKWALYKMGKIKNAIRLPLTPLSEQYQQTVLKAMYHAHLFDEEKT